MKSFILIVASLCLSIGICAQGNHIPMTTEQWTYQDTNVAFIEHLGSPSMQIMGYGEVILKNYEFKEGTIEFDYLPTELGFCGITFRRSSTEESPLETVYGEFVYLRNFDPEGNKIQGGIQYAPYLRGTNLWDLLFEYEAPAAIKQADKNHLKLVISQCQMKVYLNNELVLWIPELLGIDQIGTISLSGKGIYSNLMITKESSEKIPDAAGVDLTDHDMRYLRHWEYSPPTELPLNQAITSENIPDSTVSWTDIEAERFGMINLTRHLSSPFTEKTRKVVWLKTMVESEVDQHRKLDLGFSDDVWVFNQGYLTYFDKNTYAYPIQKQPNGRLSLENATINLPLAKGENVIHIAVASDFFGWGLIARFERIDGLIFK